MLAVETGWTPDMIADLPVDFRSACHWLLFARTLVGPNGLPADDIPKGLSPEAKLALVRQQVETAKIRTVLYPED